MAALHNQLKTHLITEMIDPALAALLRGDKSSSPEKLTVRVATPNSAASSVITHVSSIMSHLLSTVLAGEFRGKHAVEALELVYAPRSAITVSNWATVARSCAFIFCGGIASFADNS